MDMQNYTTPFANTGDTEEFSIDTDPSGKVSLEKGWTELYQLRPEEGGLFILRKVFNQMLKLVSTDTVTWKTQSFPNWIDDKGDGTPYAYPKNAIVKYTDGNIYVSKVDNNTAIPTDTNSWVNFEDFGSLNINALDEKTIPSDTDNLALQETGGLLKKLSFANLKLWILSLFNPSITGTATLTGVDNKIVMTGIVSALSLEKGDVIKFISGANAQNSRERSVESIINDNEIIVNYEHCGNRGNGSLKLSDETSITCTVKRVVKWFNCSNTLGRAPLPLPWATYMPINTILQNNTGRDMLLSSPVHGTLGATQYSFDQVTWYDTVRIYNNQDCNTMMAVIPKDAYYKNVGTYYSYLTQIIAVR